MHRVPSQLFLRKENSPQASGRPPKCPKYLPSAVHKKQETNKKKTSPIQTQFTYSRASPCKRNDRTRLKRRDYQKMRDTVRGEYRCRSIGKPRGAKRNRKINNAPWQVAG